MLKPRRKEEHHTHDDENCHDAPNEIEDFLGFVVKEEIHGPASEVLESYHMVFVRHKRDPVRLMWRRLFILIFFALVVVMMQGVWGVYEKERESRALRYAAEKELRDLRVREAELRGDISSLSHERGKEEVLRERFDLGKEEEGVVVIVEPSSPEPPPSPTHFERMKGWFSWW